MILWIIVLTIGATASMFYAGFGSLVRMHSVPNKAQIWGRRLPKIPKIEKMRVAGVLGWIGFIVVVIMVMIVSVEYMWDSDYTNAIWLLPLLGTVVGLLMGMLFIKPAPWLEKQLVASQNALCLGELPIIRDVDSRIADAKTIVLRGQGIALLDQNNYEYFTAVFSNYHLGDLSNDGSLALLGYYFRQKYAGQYKYEAHVEKVTVGNYTVANGVSAINFERIG